MCSTEALSLRLFVAGLWFVLIMFIYLCEDYRNEKERRRYSPLAIGLFSKTICLALPTREYSEEELYRIFRHESIHLLRQDNNIKFSTVFLCAVGWFIPSVWSVMKRAAEDLELCCDEIVTADMGKAARNPVDLLADGGVPVLLWHDRYGIGHRDHSDRVF